MKLYHCRNCGRKFQRVHRLATKGQDGGRVHYCSDLCRRAADRRRRRVKRQADRAGRQSHATEAFCYDCEVSFVLDFDSLSEHESCDWYILKEQPRECLECGKQQAPVDGLFCSDAHWLKHWRARIPHDPKHPLTPEQITHSEHFAKTLFPSPTRDDGAVM